MKLIFLYGVNCTKQIWDYINPYLSCFEIDYVEYPHCVTSNAKKVDDITEWVFKIYGRNKYDAIIGHSLGGIIALQLVADYNMKVDKIIYLDTNLKPMTEENMGKYGEKILRMLSEERKFYSPELLKLIQSGYDFSNLVNEISQEIYAIYGDRGLPAYNTKIQDLNLSAQIINKINIIFVHNSCHLAMVENPEELSEKIKEIVINS